MAERNGDDEWVAERLKVEASRYEPDLDRIRARIRDGRADQPARRSTWLLPAAAATFVVLTAGAVGALHGGRSPSPAGQVKLINPTGTPTQSPSGAPTEAPSTVSPTRSSLASSTGAPTPTPVATPKSTTPPDSPNSPGTTGTTVRPEIEVQRASVDSGEAVKLPGDGIDWIGAGTQSGNQTVRRQNGDQLISGPHETGSATSTLTDGPFAVSWTGGMPEPTGSGSRKWRSVSGPADGPETGFFVRVPAHRTSGVLVLYVGAGGADGQLRSQIGEQGKVSRTRLKAVSGGGYVVTIRFHTKGPDDQLIVKLISGSGGSVSFAAATLR
jgi:hypothetical protein